VTRLIIPSGAPAWLIENGNWNIWLERVILSMRADARRWPYLLALLMILAGLTARVIGLGFISLDMSVSFQDWYRKMAQYGLQSLREPFFGYTPPYLYLLWLATLTRGILPEVVSIKLISIVFDLLNAWLVYRIVRIKARQGPLPVLAAAGFLLLPTVWINSAWWGQADALYTCFLLACVYFLMQNRPFEAMIALGFSFSIKAQAAFLGPLILLLILRRKIPWYYLALIPVVYLVVILPAAWAGAPLLGLLTVYQGQAGTFQVLSKNAPNLYVFTPDRLYLPILVSGLLLTVAVLLIWAYIYARRIREFNPSIILLCALASAALAPFVLPKMHDRYFYLADVLSHILVFFLPGMWYIPLAFQLISGLAYSVFLLGIAPPHSVMIIKLAASLNTIVLAWLLVKQYRLTRMQTDPEVAEPAAQDGS
jgi:Gpi18-like mannosyltransferase